MKIPASLRNAYTIQQQRGEQLKTLVDPLIRGHLKHVWHYESRIKEMESFTLKVETGRVKDPSALEDFFAATLVVRNFVEVAEAEKILASHFEVAYRKPKTDTETHKRPDTFSFDDLRLYVRWKDDSSLPPTGLAGVLFEIQIKTFLQHAWSVATHDLTYKTEDVNWSTMRIAYQIKAMLEHAELSIQEATDLSKSSVVSKSDLLMSTLKEFIEAVTVIWPRSELPNDVRRLAENLMDIAQMVKLSASDFKAFMEAESKAGRGAKILNLSPYGTVLQSLINQKTKEFEKGLEDRAQVPPSKRRPILVTKELDIPDSMKTEAWDNATLFVG